MNTVVGLVVFFAVVGLGVVVVLVNVWGLVASRVARDVSVHASGDRPAACGGGPVDGRSGSLVHGGELLSGGDRRVRTSPIDGPGSGDGRVDDVRAAGRPVTRPSARKVALWSDVRAVLGAVCLALADEEVEP